jgi:hypothetical protein
MNFRRILSLVFAFAGISLFSQTKYGIIAPDSVLKKCEKAIISDIGKTAYLRSVRLIKCDLNSNGNSSNYSVFYAFKFPEITESHVIFTLNYISDEKGARLVRDTALKNFTRLPSALKTKNIKAMGYFDARKIASDSDPVMSANANKLYGELSTDYDPKRKDYYFTWHFYLMEPCKNCGSEQIRIYSAAVDAVSGKLIPAEKVN